MRVDRSTYLQRSTEFINDSIITSIANRCTLIWAMPWQNSMTAPVRAPVTPVAAGTAWFASSMTVRRRKAFGFSLRANREEEEEEGERERGNREEEEEEGERERVKKDEGVPARRLHV